MGGVTTVAPFLDDMTAFAESRADFLGDPEVFPVASHAVPPDGVAAVPKLLHLFLVTLPALFGKNHRLLFGGGLVVDMTRDAMNAILGMLRFYPRLEKPGSSFLVAGDTEPRIDLGVFLFGHPCTPCYRQDRHGSNKQN